MWIWGHNISPIWVSSKHSWQFLYNKVGLDLILWSHSGRANHNRMIWVLQKWAQELNMGTPVVLPSLWPVSTSVCRFGNLMHLSPCAGMWPLSLVLNGASAKLNGRNLVTPGQRNRNTRWLYGPQDPLHIQLASSPRLLSCMCISDFSSPWVGRRLSEQRWLPSCSSWFRKLLCPLSALKIFQWYHLP